MEDDRVDDLIGQRVFLLQQRLDEDIRRASAFSAGRGLLRRNVAKPL